MAANITITSPSLAFDGKTLSATLSGGTGTGYGPASGITGITIRRSGTGGEAYHQASVTITGTTLTVTLDTPVPSGTTTLLDAVVGSNIADSGANTLQGQTGTSVTNDSTQSSTAYAVTNTSLVVASIDPTVTSSLSGVSCAAFTSASEIRITATGTDLWMLGYSFGTGSYSVSVDGGGFSTVTHATGNIAIPLFSGQSDTTHDVVVRYVAGSAYVAVANSFRLFGALPSLSLPSGYGVTYSFKNTPAHIAVEPVWWKTSSGGLQGVFADAMNCATLGFRAQCDTVKIYGYQSGQKLSFQRDGTEIGPVTVANTSSYGWITIATGLDATAPHLYRIAGLNSPSLHRYSDVTVTGGTGFVTSSLANRFSAFFRGDSIVNAQFPDASASDVYGLGLQLDIATASLGTNGAKMPSVSVNDLNGAAPNVVVVCYGTNDAGNATAQATFESNARSYLADVRTKVPSAKIVVRAILPRSDSFASAVAVYNTYLQNAIAAVGDGNTVYRDFSLGFDPATGVHTSDALHPNAAGYAIIKNNEVPHFAGLAGGSGFTIALSAAAGPVGSPVTVTLTRAAGSTWVAGETITLSDGGAGGVFGTTTPTMTAGQTTASTTYTPGTAGVKSIAATNGQGWTNPTATTFTATDADSSSSSSSSNSSSTSSSSTSSSSSSSSSTSSTSRSSASSASSNSSSSSSNTSSTSRSSGSSASSNSSSSSSDPADDLSSESSSNDDQEPILTPVQKHNDTPMMAVVGQDLGPISGIDEFVDRYTFVKTFRGPVTVDIESPYANSEVRYTLNGKNPTPHSRLYTAPLVFRQNATGEKTTVKARVYDKKNANRKSRIIRLEFRVIPPR